MAGTGVGKFSSTAGNNTSNMTVNFAENMAPSNVNNAARELMAHIYDMYKQLGDGYFEYGDGDATYTVARSDADTITITSASDISSIYFPGRKIRITDGGANVVEGTIASSSHSSTTQTVNLTGISLASGTPTKVELGIDTAAFGGRLILDDDGDSYIEAPTDDTIDFYAGGTKIGTFTTTTVDFNDGVTITTADNSDTLTLKSTDDDTAEGPVLKFTRDPSGVADGDLLGAIKFVGDDAGGNATDYFELQSSIGDEGAGSEDGRLTFYGMVGGTARNVLDITHSNIVFNQDSQDIDFRVESDNDTHAFFVQGSNGSVGFGTSTMTTDFNVAGAAAFTTTGTTSNFKIISSDDGASTAPDLILFRDSSSPADNDFMGRLDFRGKDSAGNETDYISMYAQATDVTDGSETSHFTIQDAQGTSLLELSTTSGTAGVVFNEDSANHDFRVESNGVGHMLFVDGGNDRVGIAYSTPVSTLTVGGQITATASAVSAPTYAFNTDPDTGMTRPTTDTLQFVTNGTEAMRITSGQTISTGGESSPDVGVGGIGLSQGANDDPILTFKSSDVAHGMTAIAETDTYVKMLKNSDGGGALNLTTLSETATAFRHVACATGSNTAESLAATSVWGVDTRLKDGSSVTGPGADDNIASFRTSDQAQVIFKGDGEIFSNQSATVGTYDAYEDAQLIRAYDLNHMQGVINSKFDKFVQYNKDDLVKARLIGKDEDGNATSFVNWTGMSRLHNGAIWQQYEKHQKLASAFYKLAEKTIGKEEADKLLTDEEIQLLN
jgi:hypothetical protein